MPDPKPTEIFIAPLRSFLERHMAMSKACRFNLNEWDAGYHDGRESAFEDVLDFIKQCERQND